VPMREHTTRNQPPYRRIPRLISALALLTGTLAGCERQGSSAPPYVPRARALTVTTVPLLVKEAKSVYPFLEPAFAKGGVLDGKEVYGFSPSTLTVVEGDTIEFTFVNPEDDVHSFVLPDFVVSVPGGQITHATYVARHAGVYPITCSVTTHQPMMSGQLVVLSPAAIGGSR
jgi:plastocyanin